MKFPTPVTAYDENGIASSMNASIHAAAAKLYEILEEPEGDGSKELLARAKATADALLADHMKTTGFIMDGVRRKTLTMSMSALAAMMDASAFAAEILDAVAELGDGEPDVTLDVIRDLAFEMNTHDHARSTADWIKALA